MAARTAVNPPATEIVPVTLVVGEEEFLVDRAVHDIVAALSITVGGVSKIVDRLEVAGYCARRANPAYRRSSIIELTAPGDRLLVQLSQTVEDELERRLGPARPSVSLAGLTRTLTHLLSTIRAAGTPDATEATGSTEQATR